MKIVFLDKYQFISNFIIDSLDKSHQAFVTSLSSDQSTNYLVDYLEKIKPDFIVNCEAYGGGVHYVSQNPADVYYYNSIASLFLYEAVRKSSPHSFLINLLPNCVYPAIKSKLVEKEWLNGPVHESVFAMGSSKRLLQASSVVYFKQLGIKSANFIVPNGYGPEKESNPERTHALNGIIIRMIEAKNKGEDKFIVWGSGKPKREWLYMNDLGVFVADFIDNPTNMIEPLNIAQNKSFSIMDTAKIVKKAIGFKGEIVCDRSFQDGVEEKVMDDKLFMKLNPNFSFTPIEKGIKETVDFYFNYLSDLK